jgi:hypothetical protein
MKRRPLTPSLKPSGSRALFYHVIFMKYQQIPIFAIMPPDEFTSGLRLQSGSGWANPRGRDPFLLFKRQPVHPVPIFSGYSFPFGLLLPRIFSAMDKKASASKPSLSPQERIELLRSELESIKATTAKHKWEMLAIEMQDIKDDLSDELQAGLKDAANLLGDLGKRLVALERKVEGLTSALGKISEATAEVSSKTDR